jgi:hypothetical protein
MVCAVLQLGPALRNSKLLELMNSTTQNDLALVKFRTPYHYNMVAMNGLRHLLSAVFNELELDRTTVVSDRSDTDV